MAILVVFDITSPSSFEHVEYWMQSIKSLARQNVHRVLIGNKCDLSQDRLVSRQQAELLAARFNMNYIETSAKTNTSVELAFSHIAEAVYPRLNDFAHTEDKKDDHKVSLHQDKEQKSFWLRC